MTEEPAFHDIGRGDALVLLRGEDSAASLWAGVAPLFAEAMRLIVPTEAAAGADEVDAMLRDAAVDRHAVLAHGSAGSVAVELATRDAAGALVLIGASVPGTEAVARLAEREIPILLLWGEDDEISTAEEAERLSERLPTSTLALVPGSGHDVLQDAAVTVVPLVFEYLRSQYLGERHGHAEAGGPVPIALTRRPDPS